MRLLTAIIFVLCCLPVQAVAEELRAIPEDISYNDLDADRADEMIVTAVNKTEEQGRVLTLSVYKKGGKAGLIPLPFRIESGGMIRVMELPLPEGNYGGSCARSGVFYEKSEDGQVYVVSAEKQIENWEDLAKSGDEALGQVRFEYYKIFNDPRPDPALAPVYFLWWKKEITDAKFCGVQEAADARLELE